MADLDPCPPEFVELAHRMADAGGDIARRYFRAGVSVDIKDDASPVTVADREVEAALRNQIESAHPEHGILGEEQAAVRMDAEYIWVLDPIDGTRSFVAGVPLFGILICLLRDGRPILGMIDQPILGERWVGGAGHPTTLNGEPANTRACPSVQQAMMFTTSPDMFEGETETRYESLRSHVQLVRHGADCYAAGLLASGHADLVVEGSMQPYDYLPLVPVIENSGGIATDWEGAPLTLASDGLMLASGDPAIHDAALALIAQK
jgi:inositol-phosphate phosphatase/L-galactose 1-phosphate phosphatase/histidinol-phosphatase